MSSNLPINNEDTAFLKANHSSFILTETTALAEQDHYFSRKVGVYGEEQDGCIATELTFKTSKEGVCKLIVISKQGRCAPIMSPEVSIRTTMRKINYYRNNDRIDIMDGQGRINSHVFHKMCYFVPGLEQERMIERLKRAATERFNIFAGRDKGQFESNHFGKTLNRSLDEFQHDGAIDPFVMVSGAEFPSTIKVNSDFGYQNGDSPDVISMRKQILTHMMIQGNYYPNNKGINLNPCPVTLRIPRFQYFNLVSNDYVRWHNAVIQQMDLLIRGLLQVSEQLQLQRSSDYAAAKIRRDQAIQKLVADYSLRLDDSLTSHGDLKRDHGTLGNLHLALVEEQRSRIIGIQEEFVRQTSHYAIDCIQHRVMVAQRLMWCHAVRKWLVLDDDVSPDALPPFYTANVDAAFEPGALEPGSVFRISK